MQRRHDAQEPWDDLVLDLGSTGDGLDSQPACFDMGESTAEGCALHELVLYELGAAGGGWVVDRVHVWEDPIRPLTWTETEE